MSAARLETAAAAAFPLATALVAAGRIPGAVLGLVDVAGNKAVRVAGLAQRLPVERPLSRATLFDLASLTKVIFTTTTVLRLAAAGVVDLDAPIADAIPDLRQYDVAGAAERRLTFRQCLTHQTFLPAVEPLYTLGQDPATLRAFVLQREWRQGPPVYSDINFILLGIAVERLTGRLLADVETPPGFSFGAEPARAAATEFCTWRGRVMCGEVHDENAYAFGGAAGHAGLFGGIDAVLDFARGLLDGTGLPAEGIAAIRTVGPGHRTVGWDARHDGWSGGAGCTALTIGHTGFTGTGLWLDFGRGVAWSLLTNRVHPSRHSDSGIFGLRPAIGDAIAAALGGSGVRGGTT
jgi:CubicO group peptidase (beta-lactamase class C family)